MLLSLAIVIVLPQPHGVRALIASTILRLIFSVGLEPTLFLLGAFNVSVSAEAVPPEQEPALSALLLRVEHKHLNADQKSDPTAAGSC